MNGQDRGRVVADESMTKQICTITQKYKLLDNCFYLCEWHDSADEGVA